MEFIFELLVELLWQAVVHVFGEILVELGFESLRQSGRDTTDSNPFLASVGYLLFGLAVGAVSAWIWPGRLSDVEGVSMLSLVVNPLLGGSTMHALGRWRRGRGHSTTHLATFWGGASFALGAALARFILVVALP